MDETDEVLVIGRSPRCEPPLTEGGAIFSHALLYVFISFLFIWRMVEVGDFVSFETTEFENMERMSRSGGYQQEHNTIVQSHVCTIRGRYRREL
jgi:hypothetical protein